MSLLFLLNGAVAGGKVKLIPGGVTATTKIFPGAGAADVKIKDGEDWVSA